MQIFGKNLAPIGLPLVGVDRFLALRTAFGQALLLALQASDVIRILCGVW